MKLLDLKFTPEDKIITDWTVLHNFFVFVVYEYNGFVVNLIKLVL